MTDAAAPTFGLIKVIVNSDGTASFALPRAEVGQGITTAVAMTIADELELGLDRVRITLADAEPALVFNQFTGGSNSMHALYTPVRIAAGDGARSADPRRGAVTRGDTIEPDRPGRPGDRRRRACPAFRRSGQTRRRRRDARGRPRLKSRSAQGLVGTPQGRIDAHEIVTGTKIFAMDLKVPGALPTMVCRPPTINGTALAVSNRAQLEKMPGITDVVIIPHTQFVAGGVAVRGESFGQCIDAIDALHVLLPHPRGDHGRRQEDGRARAPRAQAPQAPHHTPTHHKPKRHATRAAAPPASR